VDEGDRSDEFGGGGVFEEVAGCAVLQGLGDVFGVVEGGEDEDFGVGKSRDDRFGGRNAVHDGHSDVHEDDIGFEGCEEVDRLFAVFGFTDDLEVGFGFEEGAESSTDERLIVYEKDSDHGENVLGWGCTSIILPG
jgi:hypothetical protein